MTRKIGVGVGVASHPRGARGHALEKQLESRGWLSTPRDRPP